MKKKAQYNPYKFSHSGSFGSKKSMMNRVDSIKAKKKEVGTRVQQSIKKISKGFGRNKCECAGGCDCVSNKKLTILILVVVSALILSLVGTYVGFRYIRKEFGWITVGKYPPDFKYPKMK